MQNLLFTDHTAGFNGAAFSDDTRKWKKHSENNILLSHSLEIHVVKFEAQYPQHTYNSKSQSHLGPRNGIQLLSQTGSRLNHQAVTTKPSQHDNQVL